MGMGMGMGMPMVMSMPMHNLVGNPFEQGMEIVRFHVMIFNS